MIFQHLCLYEPGERNDVTLRQDSELDA
jgi:hypothetical protein